MANWVRSTSGGQFRWRYHHEKGMGQSPGLTRFQNNTNDFHLTRLRLYSDWKINDSFRVFWEGIYAGLDTNSTYLPRGIDENYGDFLNLFVDVNLSESETLRIGRQELLYGAQRTVSPLDWANTRRTFDGIKWMHQSEYWAIDTFYTNFVPVNPTKFDPSKLRPVFLRSLLCLQRSGKLYAGSLLPGLR